MSAYAHSETFANLKSLKESIGVNLTSYQYLSVLDELLYRAVFPLLENTQFIELFMSQMLGWQTLNPKRKSSGIGRKAFSASVTLLILCDSPKQKLKILRKMRLDRAMLFEVLRRWTQLAKGIETLGVSLPSLETLSELSDLEKRCAVRPSHSLIGTYRTVNHWYYEALAFKHKILEKYVRLCLVTAKRDYVDLDHKVPLNDIVQVYLLTASKAIDKCDPEKGVLTSHIQHWLLSAKNVVVSTYINGTGEDSATTTLSSVTNRRVVDATIEASHSDSDLNELTHSDDEVRERTADTFKIREVAKAFDPTGFGRLSLGLEEILSSEDLDKLRSIALNT